MKIWLQLEELAVLLFSVYLFAQLPYAWWLYPLLFFTPDLSLVTLAGGKSIGAPVYNFIHHRLLALGLFVLGAWLTIPALSLAGVVLLGHASLAQLPELAIAAAIAGGAFHPAGRAGAVDLADPLAGLAAPGSGYRPGLGDCVYLLPGRVAGMSAFVQNMLGGFL